MRGQKGVFCYGEEINAVVIAASSNPRLGTEGAEAIGQSERRFTSRQEILWRTCSQTESAIHDRLRHASLK